jgi:hypothetical protein
MRPLTWLLTLCLLPAVAAPAAAAPAGAKDQAAAPVSQAETKRVVEAFRAAAKRSLTPRSGDLFALPAKYGYIIEGSYIRPATSQLQRAGETVAFTHHGNHHGTYWDYDVHIPLVLHGAGIRPGAYAAPATQQDLVPTLAHVLGAVPPEDAAGRVLKEALVPGAKKPKAVLVLVFDQGGHSLFDRHPGAYPYLQQLFARGARFTDARVTHLDPETIVGHVAIGTGAYPARTGITANRPWSRQHGAARMAIFGEGGPSPIGIESPTLADVWLQQTQNQAIVIGQSLADRAAIGMIGHGAAFTGNKKPIVNFYDDRSGGWTTHEAAFTQPAYVKNVPIAPSWQAVANADGLWRGHAINTPGDFRLSPAAARYDGDAMMAMVTNEPIGADDVTDLIFWSLKSSDYVGHRYGLESLEARETLATQDAQARRVIEHLESKLGRDGLLVAFTADHGGAPLAELTGGLRLAEDKLLSAINTAFDKRANGVGVAQHVTSTQVYLNDAELAANGVTVKQVQAFLKAFKVDGKPFFAEVFTRGEIERP